MTAFSAGYMEETTKLDVRLTSRQGTVESVSRCLPPANGPSISSPIRIRTSYTHRQMDVMKLQWRNLECDGPRRADEGLSRRRPLLLEYEATWSIAGYLEAYAGTDKAARLIRAVRDGVINIDAPLGSILTGICMPSGGADAHVRRRAPACP